MRGSLCRICAEVLVTRAACSSSPIVGGRHGGGLDAAFGVFVLAGYALGVGAGRRLFTETTAKKNLRLVDTKTFNGGIHVLVYRPT